MPHLISRDEAIAAAGRITGEGECLMCALLQSGEARVLEKNKYSSVLLSSFPRFWGQLMIGLHRHAEKFSELEPEEWHEMQDAVYRYAQVLEQKLQPARVALSKIGSPDNLPHTCPHLHLNLIPIYDRDLKPTTLFTWEHGVYAGTAQEWAELQALLRG